MEDRITLSDPSPHPVGQAHLATWYTLAEPTHAYLTWRDAALAAVCRDVPAGHHAVCDIGGGTGITGRHLARRFGWQTPRILEVGDDWATATAGGGADVLLLLDVLEHIPQPVPFLRQLHRLRRAEGVLVLDVPLWPSLYSAYDVAVGHCRRYTLPILWNQLQAAGWRPRRAHRWGLPLVPALVWRRWRLGETPTPTTITRGFTRRAWWHAPVRGLGRLEQAVFRRGTPTGICAVVLATPC